MQQDLRVFHSFINNQPYRLLVLQYGKIIIYKNIFINRYCINCIYTVLGETPCTHHVPTPPHFGIISSYNYPGLLYLSGKVIYPETISCGSFLSPRQSKVNVRYLLVVAVAGNLGHNSSNFATVNRLLININSGSPTGRLIKRR